MLRARLQKSVFLASSLPYQPLLIMPPTTPSLVFSYNNSEEIKTKYKKAIYQLYSFTKILVKLLITQYKLGKNIIKKIL